MENTIKTFKAFTPWEPTDDLTIVFTEEFPDGLSLKDQQQIQDLEANRLAHALYNTLPGGTWDRLLAHMMTINVSNLIVSHKTEEHIFDQTVMLTDAIRATLSFIDDLPWRQQLPSLTIRLKNALKVAEGE